MPYKMVSVNGGFRVINSVNGDVHSFHTSKENAEKQIRLLNGLEHGFKPKVRRTRC